MRAAAHTDSHVHMEMRRVTILGPYADGSGASTMRPSMVDMELRDAAGSARIRTCS